MFALVAVVAARLTFDATAIVLFGASCFLDWMASKSLRASFSVSAARIRLLPLVVCFAAAVWLPIDAAVVAGDWGAGINLQFLHALIGTSGGQTWIVRCFLAVVAAVIFGLDIAYLRIVAAGFLLASLSLSGHTMLQTGSLMIIHMINDGLHVLAGSFWLGSLALVPGCLALLDHPELYQDAQHTLQRFSFFGHFAVAIVILTGIVNSTLTLDHWPTRPISAYAALLGLKIVLVAGMTGLAVINRYLLVPHIRLNRRKTVAQIKAGTWSEVVLGAGVLTLVATFGVLDPH